MAFTAGCPCVTLLPQQHDRLVAFCHARPCSKPPNGGAFFGSGWLLSALGSKPPAGRE